MRSHWLAQEQRLRRIAQIEAIPARLRTIDEWGVLRLLRHMVRKDAI